MRKCQMSKPEGQMKTKELAGHSFLEEKNHSGEGLQFVIDMKSACLREAPLQKDRGGHALRRGQGF
jgi:hypothetical protein